MTKRPTVLFVCVHNAGRSQMAAGYLRTLAGDRVEVLSAGSEPAESVNQVVVAAMAGQGIDVVRPIRDEIKARIERLLAEILPA
jgi:arsenate reductase